MDVVIRPSVEGVGGTENKQELKIEKESYHVKFKFKC